MNKNPVIAVLYHIFYEDSCEAVCLELQPLQVYKPVFLFNICADTPGKKNMADYLKRNFPGCFILFTSNKGKDIGAKLAMLALLMEMGMPVDYLLLLHDKKSLQALNSATWKNDLLKIILPENIELILQSFQQHKECGIIATRNYIVKERVEDKQFAGVNGMLLESLLKEYNIRPDSLEFVAGTMFWVKAAPLLQFFEQHHPLNIRQRLENGNVIDNFAGTFTHSWERMLSWIVTVQKFNIQGI